MKNKKIDKNYKIIDQYVIDQSMLLGIGSFSRVYLGHHQLLNTTVAVKQIPLNNHSPIFIPSIRNEIRNMQLVHHQNIVKLLAVKKSSNYFYMICQYCNKGSIEKLLNKHKNGLGQAQSIRIVKQTIVGFKCLYQHNIVHRDLKPANILLHDQFVKVADFGLSKLIIQHGMQQQMIESLVGTPQYMSPQIFALEKYSSKTDIWSLGQLFLIRVIFYQLLYGKTPWNGRNRKELYDNIRQKPLKFPELPMVNQQIKCLIRKMLEVEEKNRISWEGLFSEKVFSNSDHIVNIIQKLNEIGEYQFSNVFEKTRKLNKLYFENNLILNNPFQSRKKQNIIQIMFNQQSQTLSSNSLDTINSQKNNQEQINQILKKQRDQVRNKKQIEIVVDYIISKRNKAAFYNHVAIQVYQQKSDLDYNMMFKVIYALMKYSIRSFYKLYKRLRDKQLNKNELFNVEQEKLFHKSEQRQFLFEFIRYDLNVCKLYFDQLLKNLKKILQTASFFHNFQILRPICNNKICQKKNILAIIKEGCVDLLKMLKYKECKKLQDYLLTICYREQVMKYNKEKYFNWNKFYQDIHQTQINELIVDIQL